MWCHSLPSSNLSSVSLGGWSCTPKGCFPAAVEQIPVHVRPCSQRTATENIPCVVVFVCSCPQNEHYYILRVHLPLQDSPPHKEPGFFHIWWGEKAKWGTMKAVGRSVGETHLYKSQYCLWQQLQVLRVSGIPSWKFGNQPVVLGWARQF